MLRNLMRRITRATRGTKCRKRKGKSHKFVDGTCTFCGEEQKRGEPSS